MKFASILVHVDTSDDQALLPGVSRLALSQGARLTVVETLYDSPLALSFSRRAADEVTQGLLEQKSQGLDQLARSLRGDNVDVTTKILRGRTSTALIQEVLREGHDVVVKQVKGKHSRMTSFFGTTARRLLRKCPCPVWLVGRGKTFRFERVLAAVDVTPNDEDHDRLNHKIMELAVMMREGGSRVDVAHAWSTYCEVLLKEHMQPDEFEAMVERARSEHQAELTKLLAGYEEFRAEEDRIHLPHGEPWLELPKLIAKLECDLLIMGTVARAGIAGLLGGNTAEAILDEIHCSLLALKPEGFASPVKVDDPAE